MIKLIDFLREGDNIGGEIQKGDYIKYINPANHSKFKKNISFWTNQSKDENKPFEVYIRDGAIGVVEDIVGDIATVKFSPKWFIPDSVNTNIPYKIYTGYLEVLKNVTGSKVNKPFTGKLDYSKVTEDEDSPGSSKLSHMSLGMKTTRVVISGDDVAANQEKILKLGQEMDPNFDAKFFPATGKIVGSMSQVKVQPLNLKLRDRKWKATAESKTQSQSLKK